MLSLRLWASQPDGCITTGLYIVLNTEISPEGVQGPGSFLWTCHLVSMDPMESSMVSMEGAGAEVGAAAAGDSGCQPAGPIGQDPASLMGQHGKVF